MTNIMKKISILGLFALFLISNLSSQSNKPYAKDINLSLKDDNLIITWQNPPNSTETSFSIDKIYIYFDTNPILSSSQLIESNLLVVLDSNQNEYIVKDKKYFSNYYAVIYKMKNQTFYDVLIISENTTSFNNEINKGILDLLATSPLKNDDTEIEKGLEIGTLRNTPLPKLSLSTEKYTEAKIKLETEKSSNKIAYYVFQEEKVENAVGTAYQLYAIVSDFFPSERFLEAANELENLLQNKFDEKTTARIHFYLGECYYFTGNYKNALNCFLLSEKSYFTISKQWQQIVLNSFSF